MARQAPTIAASSPIARCRKPPILAFAYISPARSSKRRMSIIFARISRATFFSGRSCDACSTPVSSGLRTRVASFVATPVTVPGSSADPYEIDHEEERLIRADLGRGLVAVRQVGRDNELPAAAYTHALDP